MARTGIPVAIDGAAAFDRLCDRHEDAVGAIPVAMSFHATKCFATGEGGCVVATDAELLSRVERALNFGFYETRESRSEAINGKMSEYHAAVGLAALDGWEVKRSALDRVFAKYREAFDGRGIGGHLFVPPRVGASYALFLCPDHPAATRVREGLDRNGVGNRLWYGMGLHRQPAFARGGDVDLPATDDLTPRLLGLPLAPDLEDGAIERVAAIAADAVTGIDPGA